MIPLVGAEREFSDLKAMINRVAVAVGGTDRLSSRHYDRNSPRRPPRRPNRRGSRVFQLWDQRSDPAHLWLQPRRRRQVPSCIRSPRHSRRRSIQSLDQEGTGQLVRLGTERGRSTRPQLKVGICGEHGRRSKLSGLLPQSGVSTTCPVPPTGCPSPAWAAAQATFAE